MQCPKCSVSIPDDSDFCPMCGAATERLETTAQPLPSAANEADGVSKESKVNEVSKASEPPKAHRGACITGIICGIFCVCVGIAIAFVANPGCEATSFGGDAYTFIYQGIVAIANTAALFTKAVGACLMAIGAFMACYFGNQLGAKR